MSRLFDSSYTPPVRAGHLYEVCLGLRKHNIPKILVRHICEGFLFTASVYAVQFLKKFRVRCGSGPYYEWRMGIFWKSRRTEHRPFVGTIAPVEVNASCMLSMPWPIPCVANPLPGVPLQGEFLQVDDFNSHEIKVISIAMQKFPWLTEDPAHYFFTGLSYTDHVGNAHLRFVAAYVGARTGISGAALSDCFDGDALSLPYFEIILMGVLHSDYWERTIGFELGWLLRSDNMLLLWSILKKHQHVVLLNRLESYISMALDAHIVSAEDLVLRRIKWVLDRATSTEDENFFDMVERLDQQYLHQEEERIAEGQRSLKRQANLMSDEVSGGGMGCARAR